MPDYLPDEILHRESELKEIVFCLKSLDEQRKQPSILIYGLPGTGKTCTAKFVVKEFSEYSQRAQLVYVNCWQSNTRYAILTKIAQSMDTFVPSTGISIEDLLVRMKQAHEESKRVPLVILDEFDVLHKTGEDGILYDLLRLQELYGIGIGLILITNDVAFVAKLDRRIRSSLAQNAIEFPPYGPQELKDIIRERAKIALFSGTYSDEVIGSCAGFAAKNGGDSRVAIALLWMAGKNAERENKKVIELSDIETAKAKIKISVSEIKQEKTSAALREEEKQVLEVITAAKEEISSGELYEKLKMNERSVRNYLARLEELGLIESEEKALKSGRTRVFRIKGNKNN